MTWEAIAQVSLTLGGGAFLTLLAYLGKSKVEALEESIKQLWEKIESVEAEMAEFRDNYLDRFEKVNHNITESKEQIIEKIHALEMKNK